jgi:hypothetical protein
MIEALRQAKPARGSPVGTPVERKTRFVVLCKMRCNEAAGCIVVSET